MSEEKRIGTKEELKAEARRFGFSSCGVAVAEEVDADTQSRFSSWLESGNNASMSYMERNTDKRLDPRLLLPSAKSVIVVALNYYPGHLLASDQYQFAYYAYGKDYHDVMRTRMSDFAHSLGIRDVRDKKSSADDYGFEGLVCCDTVPMLDRYWAWKSGIGWIGKNTSLIIPGSGSFFFIGEIITEMEFLDYDSPVKSHCGKCSRCINACPTGALCEPYILDAHKCLSFLTIENRDSLPEGLSSKMGNCIYGCDRCQLACPHNSFVKPTEVTEFVPSDEFLSMQVADWQQLTQEDYQTLFKDSAVKRAKYEGLKRNIDELTRIK